MESKHISYQLSQSAPSNKNAHEDCAILQKQVVSTQRELAKEELLKQLQIAEVRAEKAETEARQANVLVREALEIARKAETRAANAEKKLEEAQWTRIEPSSTSIPTQMSKSLVWDVATLKQKIREIFNTEDTSVADGGLKVIKSVAVQTDEKEGEIVSARKLKNAVDRARKKAEQKVKHEEGLRKEAEEKVTLLEAQVKETRDKVKEYDSVLKTQFPDYEGQDIAPGEWNNIMIREECGLRTENGRIRRVF